MMKPAPTLASENSYVISDFDDKSGQFDTDWDATASEDSYDAYLKECEEYEKEELGDDYISIPEPHSV